MNLRHEYLIAYDIVDNRSREKIYNVLLSYGMKHIQKSVFWGLLLPAELSSVKRLFTDTLDTEHDKLFIITSNLNGQCPVYSLGYSDNIFKDWDEYGSI